MHRNTLDQQGLLNLCPRSSSLKSPMPLSWSHGQLFIDVGAHDGEDALAFASMGRHHVLSFEPALACADKESYTLTRHPMCERRLACWVGTRV